MAFARIRASWEYDGNETPIERNNQGLTSRMLPTTTIPMRPNTVQLDLTYVLMYMPAFYIFQMYKRPCAWSNVHAHGAHTSKFRAAAAAAL